MYLLLTKDAFGEAYNLEEVEDEKTLKERIVAAAGANKTVKIARPLKAVIESTITITDQVDEPAPEDPSAPDENYHQENSDVEASPS